MTETFTSLSLETDSTRAGMELGLAIRKALNGAAPDAIVLFASARHDHTKLLEALAEESGTRVIVGSSSAGEFSHESSGEGQVSALAIRSSDMAFRVGVGRELGRDPEAAAKAVAASFAGVDKSPLPYRAALVMTDALAGHADAVVEKLTLATRGNYTFFGGGAGDDGRFQKTHVFAGTEAVTNAVVALEILSLQPLGVGVSHGWIPAGDGMRVTEAQGSRLVSLNGVPAFDVMADFAAASGQKLDRNDPLPFFLHNILGIQAGDHYRLRVPLAVEEDGAIVCAADVPSGSIVHVMKTTQESAVLAAEQATRAALVFDCVATRLRMGRAFGNELKACADLLAPAGFVGCNTYGQIARAEGQFGGFHNCTAVVCVLPQ